MVFRPLAGCGLFRPRSATGSMPSRFPSPCGVWVVSVRALPPPRAIRGFRPLAGCGLFPGGAEPWCHRHGFRPLAGCGLFLGQRGQGLRLIVSVPLRGVGCFVARAAHVPMVQCFRPLAGCGLFLAPHRTLYARSVSVPLRGVGCFIMNCRMRILKWFPSPCGVWVVSGSQVKRCSTKSFRPLAGCGLFLGASCATGDQGVSVPLRGVGCFGKAAHSFWCNRKKNCQLCYFIVSYWQMFINSKLRNCKVPCEAHKTAT